MKNKKMLLKAAGAAVGCGFVLCIVAFALAKFDLRNLNTAPKREKKVYEANLKNVNSFSLKVKATAVIMKPISGNTVKITYYANENEKYSFEKINNTFQIEKKNETNIANSLKSSFMNFEIQGAEMLIEVPDKFRGSIKADNSVGDVEVLGFKELEEIDISTSYGDIEISETIIRGQADTRCSTGSIILSNIKAEGNLDMSTSYGDIQLLKSEVKEDLMIENSTGDIELDKLETMGYLHAKTSYGDILMKAVTAGNGIYLKNATGSIEGTVKGSLEDYQVKSHVSVGDNNLPKEKMDGSKMLNAETSYGDIEIDFVP